MNAETNLRPPRQQQRRSLQQQRRTQQRDQTLKETLLLRRVNLQMHLVPLVPLMPLVLLVTETSWQRAQWRRRRVKRSLSWA